MEYLGSHYAVVLHDTQLREGLTADHEQSAIGGAESTTGGVRARLVTRVRLVPRAALVAVASCMLALAAAFGIVSAPAPAAARPDEQTDVLTSIELAQAFTAALNAHDVEALVDLFTEDDSGPTVNADAYAWQKFEIRLWARKQASMRIYAAAYGYLITEHGAAWNAEVFRDDWQEWGVSQLPVTNSIWVRDGKLVNFTSILRDPRDAIRLSSLWVPNSSVQR